MRNRASLSRQYKILAMFVAIAAMLACAVTMAAAPRAEAQSIPALPGGGGTTDPAPRVSSIVRADANPTKSSTVTFTVTFSEGVYGVNASDFSLTTSGVSGASVSSVSMDDVRFSTRTVTVNTGSGSGTIRLNVVDNDSIKDHGGNSLVAGYVSGESYTVDKTQPTVTINQASSQADPTNTQPIAYSVVFSEAVTGFAASDVSLSGTAAGKSASVSGSGSSYTVSVNGITSGGTVIASIPAGVASDQVGNTNTASTSTDKQVTYDVTAPKLGSMDDGDEDNIVSPGDTLTYTLTFNEDIDSSTLSSADFDNAGSATISIGTITETSPGVFGLKVTPSTTGTLILRIPSGASIKDAAGNGLATPVQDADTVKVGGPAPMVSSITLQGENPIVTPSTEFLVTFSEAVSGIDKTDFKLTTTGNVSGASILSADKLQGSDNTAKVQVNTGTGSGTLRLDLIDDDTIKDSDQNPLGGPGGTLKGDFTSGDSVTLDKEFPVTIEQASAQSDPASEQPVVFDVKFRPNEIDHEELTNEVVGFEASDVELSGSAQGGTASVSGGSGGDYKVSVDGLTSDGTVKATIPAGAVLDSDSEQRPNEASTSTDNEVAYKSNAKPTISEIADRTIEEDGSSEEIAFGVDDQETTAGDLQVIGSSSNKDLVPDSNIVLGGTGKDRTVKVTPAADGSGTATITLSVKDADGASSNESFELTVKAVNDAPIGKADTATTDEDTPVEGNVLSNDSDQENNDLTAKASSQPAHGTLTLEANGSFIYTPDADYNGTDEFTYKASDGTADGDATKVSITVKAVNDAPKADAQSIRTDEDVATDLTLRASDVEEEGLSYAIVDAPAHGTISGGAGANRTYTPDANFNGTDKFTYKANDGIDESNTATVSITVIGVNDEPTVSEISDQSTDEDTPTGAIAFGVDDQETAAGDLTLKASSSDTDLVPSANAEFGGSGTNRTVTLTPTTDRSGATTIALTATDADGASSSENFTLTVKPVNDAPAGEADTATTEEDTPVDGNVLANDSDQEGGSLTVKVAGSPAHGTLTLDADGYYTYKPEPNYTGTDEFTYTVCDADGACSTEAVRVTVEVTAVNDAPRAADDSYGANEDLGLLVGGFGVLRNDTDPEGDSLRAIKVSGPSHGRVDWDSNGTFLYMPEANFNGTDSFTYKVSDGTLESDVATVTLNVAPSNDVPVTVQDAYETDEGQALTVAAPGVLSNDTDLEDEVLTAERVGDPAHGTLVLEADGSFVYTPEAGYSGTDEFTYKASDGELSSDPTKVSITVKAVNDAPVIPIQTVILVDTTNEDVSLNLRLFATDVDGDALSYTIVDAPAHGTISGGTGANRTYVPEANYNGTDSFTYKAHDGTAYSNVATFRITIDRVNDDPVVSSVTTSGTPVDEGSSATTKVTATDPDSPASNLRYSFDCDADNAFEIGPQASSSAACTFDDGAKTYKVNAKVTDGEGGSATGFSNVGVRNVAPTVTNIAASTAQAMVGQNVTFTGTATDPSLADKSAGFNWQWSKDGGAYVPGAGLSNSLLTSFNSCGPHNVSAKATDKDGGVSLPFSANTARVNVSEGHFRPPLNEGAYNTVQKGQGVPVKITIGCGATNLTGLTPSIQLLSGDQSAASESGVDPVETTASSIDSSGFMYSVEGGYQYNLKVPTSFNGRTLQAGDLLTVRVNPFGTSVAPNPAGSAMYIVLRVRK